MLDRFKAHSPNPNPIALEFPNRLACLPPHAQLKSLGKLLKATKCPAISANFKLRQRL